MNLIQFKAMNNKLFNSFEMFVFTRDYQKELIYVEYIFPTIYTSFGFLSSCHQDETLQNNSLL